ncbi:MAG: hypothetical protein U9Q99_01665 [Nanoarchaeota archaeon]|nr:hypothetical protein [Nanoarchaeota archaeon]
MSEEEKPKVELEEDGSSEAKKRQEELLKKQKDFEYESKKLEPAQIEAEKRAVKKEKIWNWIIIGIVIIGMSFLTYYLL